MRISPLRKNRMRSVEVKANKDRTAERGSAIVICLFVLALITVFVTIALTRTSSEALAVGNETAEGRTFYAAQGSLEVMTRNFNKVFEVKLNPTTADLNSIRTGAVPNLTAYTFVQELDQTSARQNVVLSGGPYSGLYAVRDNWRLRTTATDNTGVQVQLARNILNSRIPIFQFGVFYDDDLELYRPPRFSFGGRVHTNGNFFISPGSEGVYFNSRVTASAQIVTQSWRNWYTGDSGNSETYIKNASGVDRQFLPTYGSVLNTTNGAADNIFSGTDLPPSRVNNAFQTQTAIFDGNIQATSSRLRLPLKVGYPTDLVEMVRRGKRTADANGGDLYTDSTGTLAPVPAAAQDDDILRPERYSNKTGIRISLADSKAKLPGCASGSGVNAVTTPCGVRLDGHPVPTAAGIDPDGTDTATGVRGYAPLPMKLSSTDTTWGYRSTRVNGERMNVSGVQQWIKVELVSTNQATQAIITQDITEDFLSMGITEESPQTSVLTLNAYSGTSSNNGTATAPSSNLTATTAQTASTLPDSRSIIKLQRWLIPGEPIPGGSNVLTSFGTSPADYSVVRRFTGASTEALVDAGCVATCVADDLAVSPNVEPPTWPADRERYAHLKRATVNGVANVAVVPFPAKLFDTREGTYYDERSTTYYTDLSRLTRNGIMTTVNVDIANLRRFLRGDFNGLLPTTTPFAVAKSGVGLVDTDVPQREGWVVYVSDRRGDANFNGRLDMEDVYSASPGNGGTLQAGEDINGDSILNVSYGTETERYNTNTSLPDMSAVRDHKYFRRGVRLINGTVLPGVYDAATPANTRGFSFASENGIYVQGNYNATRVTSVPSTGNTPYDQYEPFDQPTHIPASIVGDSATILSNGWRDGQSFVSPYDQSDRVAQTTQMRFALISGDTIQSRESTPNQGGISPGLNGGVHNFKRFLEIWTGQRLDFSGSLINLFNSNNNNGSFKCCNTVYNPPIRNWVFDSTFLDPSRLPPGTPFFQYIQTTGFQRTNE